LRIEHRHSPPLRPGRVRPAVCLVATVLSIAAVGCTPAPTPEQVEAALQEHPDILYRVIERHPAEFIAALDKAARASAGAREEASRRDLAVRTEDEFRHPKLPRIERRAVFGNPGAPITIVEYSDFQCPYCRAEREVLVRLLREYGDSVRLVVKHTPLEMHPVAMPAALMYEAVARQSPMAAYRFYDDLFTNQEKLDSEGEGYLPIAAHAAGADSGRARADARSAEVRAVIEADLDEGRRFGFTGTPGFLINGVALMGAHPLGDFEQIINRHLAMARSR
jgi:protein-disulfide isomerase